MFGYHYHLPDSFRAWYAELVVRLFPDPAVREKVKIQSFEEYLQAKTQPPLGPLTEEEKGLLEGELPFRTLDDMEEFFNEHENTVALMKQVLCWGAYGRTFILNMNRKLFAPWLLAMLHLSPK